MKRELPLMITAAVGLFMILSFFVPHHVVSVPADFLQSSAIIIVAFGYVLGGANVLKLNAEAIYRRNPGWIYKLILVVALISTVVLGLFDGCNRKGAFLEEGSSSKWIYDQFYSPMSATMFSMLAFYIASAAFRAFRIRTVEAGLLAVAALIVMLGRVPVGSLATSWLPGWLQLPTMQEWIMEIPQNAAKRAILIGAALGVMATGLRVILGIERSYLSGED
ncbi:MAG TPA: hypothetical protein VFQ05_13145 [Candidatus Eisenbacteria bacterium]|nr:hypothetical protein [Candidatus Eisenbacteria bacterium]